MVVITKDELAILSTAIAIVQKDSERRRGFVLCADGKLRRLSKEQAVTLIEKITTLSGLDGRSIRREAMELAKEVS